MQPDRIFRLQCQASHTRKSISAMANEMHLDPAEISVTSFLHLLDTIVEAPTDPHWFTEEIGFAINTD